MTRNDPKCYPFVWVYCSVCRTVHCHSMTSCTQSHGWNSLGEKASRVDALAAAREMFDDVRNYV